MSEQNDALAVRTDAMLRELAPVHDIPLQIAIEVGRLRLKVRDLMKLAPDLDRRAEKTGRRTLRHLYQRFAVARGEVIVVEHRAMAGCRLAALYTLEASCSPCETSRTNFPSPLGAKLPERTQSWLPSLQRLGASVWGSKAYQQ